MSRTRTGTRFGPVIAVSLLVVGCAPVGPNYARPVGSMPPQYRFIEQAAAGEALADSPWWRVFADPTLQALIREAIAGNLDLQTAAARVELARAQAGIARSFLYPQVDGTASESVQQNSGTAGGDVQRGGVYGFRVSWELDLFGRLRRERESAVARMLASEQGRRGVLVTLVADVATNYFLLRQLDVELDIARRTLEVNNRTVTYFQDRLDGGVSNRLEVDRIRSNRSQTAAAIPDFEQQIAFVENTLSLLLARPPGPIARDALAVAPPVVPPGVPASLLERRPDVLQAEQLLVAANANIGAARALFFPSIGLTGFLGGVSGELTTLLGGAGAVWSLGAGLLQPVFQAGRNQRNLDAARAGFDEALAQYRKAALNGYREVANALVSIQKASEVQAHRQEAVTVLRDAGDLARSRYESGLATYLEILDADEQLFQQELLLAQTQRAALEARADLYRALGGGWEP